MKCLPCFFPSSFKSYVYVFGLYYLIIVKSEKNETGFMIFQALFVEEYLVVEYTFFYFCLVLDDPRSTGLPLGPGTSTLLHWSIDLCFTHMPCCSCYYGFAV